MRHLIRCATTAACYWICEALGGYAEKSTTRTMLTAGSAVAAVQVLDIEAALSTGDLPMQTRATLSALSTDEWRGVLAIARDEIQFLEEELRLPEFAHLRRTRHD